MLLNLVTKNEFDKKLTSFKKQTTSNKTKQLEVEKKLDSLTTKDYNFFLGRIYFTCNDVSQNMFVYQPAFNVLELKIDKSTEYINGLKSKRLYNCTLIALHGAFLPNATYFGVKIGMQFNNISLVIEIINYATKVVYIVYDLDNWPKNYLKKFALNKCLFGATNIVKNSDKEKYVYSGYGIAFGGKCVRSFGNDSAKIVIILEVDNSSSCHVDNLKTDFLILGKGPTFRINRRFGI